MFWLGIKRRPSRNPELGKMEQGRGGDTIISGGGGGILNHRHALRMATYFP